MDAIKEFEEMEFVKAIDLEEFINSQTVEMINNNSFTLKQIHMLKKFLNYADRSIDNLNLKNIGI